MRLIELKCTPFAIDHTVEQQLEEFKGCGVGANIPRVTDAIAYDDDAGMIRIVFIVPHFTHYHGVADLLLVVPATRLEWGVVPEPIP